MAERVLIIEDSISIAGLEQRYLEREGFEVAVSTTGADALHLLNTGQHFDILIIDYNLPDISGVTLLQTINRMGLTVPSVIVTAAGNEQVAVASLKLGAMDYIVKDRDTIKNLPETCRDVLKRFRMEAENTRLMDDLKRLNTELSEANVRLEDITRKDDLTGVFNRRYLMEILGREVYRSARYRIPLSFAIFDIDHFKRVNDNHGHLAGDLVLNQFAQTVSARIRRTDYFGRYGGEEFAVVITNTPLRPAFYLCEELREIIASASLGSPSASLRLTVSAGLAEFTPDMSLNALIDIADKGLYASKEAGRNRITALQMAA